MADQSARPGPSNSSAANQGSKADKPNKASRPPRSGNASSSKKKRTDDIPSTPGDPKNMLTFITIENNEQRLSAYLGYNDNANQRKMCVTWPILRANIAYDRLGSSTGKKRAMHLILDREEAHQGHEPLDPPADWQIDENKDSKEIINTKKSRIHASILLNLEKDISALETNDIFTNQNLQDKYTAQFRAKFPDRALLSLDYASHKIGRVDPTKSPFPSDDSTLKTPILGPLIGRGEHRLEAINRIWNLLKYQRYQSQSGHWATRYSAEACAEHIQVRLEFVPEWMREDRKRTIQEAQTSRATVIADTLTEKSFQIEWDLNASLKGKNADDMREKLERAEEEEIYVQKRNTPIPLKTDPRLFSSGPQFRDSVRRLYNCQKLHLDIKALDAVYTGETGEELVLSVLHEDWMDCRRTFEDPAVNAVRLRLVLKVHEDSESSVFEAFGPSPELEDMFDTSTGDVQIRQDKIAANAAHILGSGTGGNDDPSDLTDETDHLDQEAAGGEKLFTALDNIFAEGSGAASIGEAPDPTTDFPDRGDQPAMMRYYDNFDVTDSNSRREWQNQTISSILLGDTPKGQTERLPRNVFSKEEAFAIEEAKALGAFSSMALEGEQAANTSEGSFKSSTLSADDEREYHVQRTAFSGTAAQVGPPYDICLDLLDCVEEGHTGRLRSSLLNGLEGYPWNPVTTSRFYDYQLSGAIGCILKMYGQIDAQRLLERYPNHPRAEQIKTAASKLTDLCIHGAILGDEVGFGKTKEMLVVAYLHSVLTDEKAEVSQPLQQKSANSADSAKQPHLERAKVLFRPMLLLVPSGLIDQWIQEILKEWPFFELLVSYHDHAFQEVMRMASISYTAMKSSPSTEDLPTHLKYIWDTSDPRAGRTIVLSSYETHQHRAGIKTVKHRKGVHFKPPRYKSNTEPREEIWKKPPVRRVYWDTQQQGIYSLGIFDEAHKLRNYSTGIYSVMVAHQIRKHLKGTATPAFNQLRDLLALFALLWQAARKDYEHAFKVDKKLQDWRTAIKRDPNRDLFAETLKLERTDIRRLGLLNPHQLRAALRRKIRLHAQVAERFGPACDMTMIRRSPSSKLASSDGTFKEIKSYFKKITRKTAHLTRRASEELEYQFFHREAAEEYLKQLAASDGSGDRPIPKGPALVQKPRRIITPMGPSRILQMANFATKLSRLNNIMEKAKKNTHTAQLAVWREQGKEGTWLMRCTRAPGESEPKTAKELLAYLTEGSPVCRFALQVILQAKALEPLNTFSNRNPGGLKQHQKVLMIESLPANAWYLVTVLRIALIDARVMHSGLSHESRKELQDQFNDRHSTLKVLILMYDVVAVGLNLQKACNHAAILSVASSYNQEEQGSGRLHRINSAFDTVVFRRETYHSHDQFRVARQTDKATVQLAANIRDPSIRALVVKLLNELQPEVDEAHNSDQGRTVAQARMHEEREERILKAEGKKRKTRARTKVQSIEEEEENLHTSIQKMQERAEDADGSKDTPRKRIRRAPARYSDVDYDPDEGFLLDPDHRDAARRKAAISDCDTCGAQILVQHDGVTCGRCGCIFHWICTALDGPLQGADFECYACQQADDKRQKSKASGGTKSTSGNRKKGKSRAKTKAFADVEEDDEMDLDSIDSQSVDDDYVNENSESDGSSDSDSLSSFDGEYEEVLISDESDDEYAEPKRKGGRSSRQQDEEEDPEYSEEAQDRIAQEYTDYLSTQQLSAEERHFFTLLTLPKEHHWTDKDLDNEGSDIGLRVGLMLLYNLIQGKPKTKTSLALSSSIHIRYDAFSNPTMKDMEKNMWSVTKKEAKALVKKHRMES